MIDTKYIPILKTGDAELRGLEYLQPEIKDQIIPLIELTRYRSVSKKILGSNIKQKIELSISKRIDKVETALGKERAFILDLTEDNQLSNEQIRTLRSSYNGFGAWCSFLKEQKKRFPKIIPVIQLSEEGSDSWDQFVENRTRQFLFLKDYFDIYVYRFFAGDPHYEEDLSSIVQVLDSKKIVCCIDLGFIPQGKGSIVGSDVLGIIQTIREKFAVSQFVVAGTSFPPSISDFTSEEYGMFSLEEVLLFSKIQEQAAILGTHLYYSDYACINPNRNSVMARGWIPKIDCPQEQKLFFYRKRRGDWNYADVYCEVAQRMIQDSKYQQIKDLLTENCWGIRMIQQTAEGNPPNLSPSFWISVRLNLAITARIKFLELS